MSHHARLSPRFLLARLLVGPVVVALLLVLVAQARPATTCAGPCETVPVVVFPR